MDILQKTLQDIGLSEKEASVYLTCLKFPNQPVSIIAKKITMNRGTTFVILHELLKKGLAKKSIAKGVMRFSVVAPEDIVSYVEKKAYSLEKNKEKIKTLLPEFKNLQGVEGSKPIFQFYEGAEGLRNLLSEVVRGEHTEIKAILSPDSIINKVGTEYIEDFMEKTSRRGYRLHLLLAFGEHEKKEYTTSKEEHRTTRYMPEPLLFPMSTYLFGDTAILISHDEDFGLSIQSKEYVAMQEVFFDTIWAISKTEVSEREFRMPLL